MPYTVAAYSIAKPKATLLNSGNPPQIIQAGKPAVIKTAFGAGIPFFTNYGPDQGLPLNNIICSTTDKAGNLWFGSGGGGIIRYDGKNFTSYTIAQGLAGVVVFSILEDRKNNLWIGTTSGLSKYDGSKFVNFTTAVGLADNFITCSIQDDKGNLWFGTHEGGVSKYDGKRFTNYNTKLGLANNYIRSILQDKKGHLWFGTDAGGVSEFDGKSFKNYDLNNGLPNNSVNCMAIDNAGDLWFGTNAGVTKYNGKNFINYTKQDGLADNNVSCILQDRNGDVWLGTHTKGVSRYDGKSFMNYTKADGLAENKINSITADRNGNVWITSQGGGVSRYEGKCFTNYTMAQGLAGNLIFSIAQDKVSNLWFGTYEQGVSKFNGSSFTNYTKAQGLPDITVWSILSDKKGNVWFGSDRGGSCMFDGKRFTNYTTAQGLAGNSVICMAQDRKGNIWFGTRGNGVSMFDGSAFTNFPENEGLAQNNVWSIMEDKAGNIWFGTFDKGLIKYDGKGFTNYTTRQGLAGNTITAIFQDKNDNIWLGIGGKGISRYDGKTFKNYSTEEGLLDNDIFGITEDTVRNMIWFGTNQGLSGVKNTNVLNNNDKEIIFKNFGKNTGYPLKDVSNGGLFADDKGIVWVGSGEGKLVRFDYAAVGNQTTTSLNLEIQGIKINHENICWNNLLRHNTNSDLTDSLTCLNEMIASFGKILSAEVLDSMQKKYNGIKFNSVSKFYPVPIGLALPYTDNNVTIDFLAIEPALPRQVRYQYQLQGYADGWSPLSNNTSAVFGNIKPGQYIFKVKAISNSGAWSQKEYTFTVLPPWWLSWWAYTLYVLAASAMIYTFYSSRIRRMKRRQAAEINTILTTQEEERKRISQDLHDDIGARLTTINLLAALGQQKTSEPNAMKEYLQRISGEIQTSGEALDDIVWSIDTKNDSMEEIAARMRRYAADIFDGTTVHCSITIDESTLPPRLNTGKRSDMFLIFKEAINNIHKHAMASAATITLQVQDSNLSMEVKDDGKGFDTSLPTHRNGLKNMQQRMQKWGGSCIVQSAPGKGAMVKIKLPIDAPSLKKGIWQWFKKR